MAKTLPGTTIAVDWNRPEEAETLLNSLFLAGGLMLSQVASLTGLEPYVIQNWVRRGFVARAQAVLPPPVFPHRPDQYAEGFHAAGQNLRPALLCQRGAGR